MFEGLLQPTHLILILAIVIIVFGPGKLPDLGKELGRGMREFRQAMNEINAPVNEMKGTVQDVKNAATLTSKPKATTGVSTTPSSTTTGQEPSDKTL